MKKISTTAAKQIKNLSEQKLTNRVGPGPAFILKNGREVD